MPQAPYIVSGVVYTTRGKVPSSLVIISDSTNNQSVQVETNEEGQYAVDLANFPDADYVIGNSYTIVAKDSTDNEFLSTTITLAGGGLTKNMFLEDRDADTVLGMKNQIASLRTVGYNPVTKDNPLPTVNDVRLFTEKIAFNGANPEYVGQAAPGTGTGEAKWRIKRFTTGASGVTDIQWANGNTEFNKVWNDRAGYNYS